MKTKPTYVKRPLTRNGVQIPLTKLRKLCDPLKDTPWCCIPFGKKEITASLKSGLFESKPVADNLVNCWPHVNRIAYLVIHGWEDPIEIDVGVPSMGACKEWWPVVDGNHRLSAAIYRGDKTILATVDGSLKLAEQLFGMDCTTPGLRKIYARAATQEGHK